MPQKEEESPSRIIPLKSAVELRNGLWASHLSKPDNDRHYKKVDGIIKEAARVPHPGIIAIPLEIIEGIREYNPELINKFKLAS